MREKILSLVTSLKKRLFPEPTEVVISGKIIEIVSNIYGGNFHLLIENEGRTIQEPIDVKLGETTLRNLFLGKTVTIKRMSNKTTGLKDLRKIE